MKNLKILIPTLSFPLLILIIAISITQNPLDAKFDATLEALMIAENTESVELLLEKYPQLQIAKNNMEKIKCLDIQVQSVYRNPAPNLGKEEGESFVRKQQQIRQLSAETMQIFDAIQAHPYAAL